MNYCEHTWNIDLSACPYCIEESKDKIMKPELEQIKIVVEETKEFAESLDIEFTVTIAELVEHALFVYREEMKKGLSVSDEAIRIAAQQRVLSKVFKDNPIAIFEYGAKWVLNKLNK